ncbi:hypothetical protein F3G63_35105, partial [Pseudomonas aeruginosa]
SKYQPQPNTNFNFVIDQDWNDYNHIYTDASKHPQGCVGVGVYHSQSKIVEKIKLPSETSVFTGECFGIYKAIEYILIFKLKKTLILTDSKSSLQALAKFPFKSQPIYPILLDCRNLLMKCMDQNLIVSFVWIPSHCGIKGNEIVDRI